MLETRRRRQDGSDILVLLSTTSLREPEGLFRSVEVSLDITERRKLERELEHSERLAAIGRIAAGMAHEINNPLSVIQSCAVYFGEVAQRSEDPELAESAEDLELAIERIRSFVQHVCGFARRTKPQLTDTPLQTAIEVATRMAKPRALDAGVSLHVELDPGASVPNDSPRLAQAILNLLSNAIDAARTGDKNVWLSVVSDDKQVRIRVEDDGTGIATEVEGRMFEPFATTKPYGQGTGLGLAITRQIMQDHRGSAILEQRDGGGARAELILPKLVTSAHHVVVLDPDPAVRRAVAQDFRRAGFKVTSAESIAAVGQDCPRPSLVVTETRLKDAEGAELAAKIRTRFPSARLLVITGDPGRQTLPNAAGFFAKPWDRDALMNTARRLCLETETLEQRSIGPRSLRP
jgi:signal transduction histidine kinase/ActR/RegA family two-component response regulator